jgi:hypothetical protein
MVSIGFSLQLREKKSAGLDGQREAFARGATLSAFARKLLR